MALPRGLRNWLLGPDSDPSVRVRVFRDLLNGSADDSEVVRAQKEIGRKGWAAKILREQHP
ncbi:MAG TPA: squalene cyclase, partial [Thermoplasmata archaeon]|nr:squalene cyclase [Thermoplasmata archaeon]